jgi:hypothetical protein
MYFSESKSWWGLSWILKMPNLFMGYPTYLSRLAPKIFSWSDKSITPQASMSLHISGLDKSISVFTFFLFCRTSVHWFSLIFHVSCTSPRSRSCGRHLSSSFHKLFILPPRYVSCFLSSCSDVSVSSSLLFYFFNFLCDFSNMWNKHSYFHATVIFAPICLKKLEDKLTELFFMTWIFAHLQFTYHIKTCGVIILAWKLSLKGSQTGLTFGIACN